MRLNMPQYFIGVSFCFHPVQNVILLSSESEIPFSQIENIAKELSANKQHYHVQDPQLSFDNTGNFISDSQAHYCFIW